MKLFDALVVVTNQWFSFFGDLVGHDIRPFKALDWLLTRVFLRFTVLWCVLAILGIGGTVSLGETSNQRIGFLTASIVTFYLLTLRATLVSSAYIRQHSRRSTPSPNLFWAPHPSYVVSPRENIPLTAGMVQVQRLNGGVIRSNQSILDSEAPTLSGIFDRAISGQPLDLTAYQSYLDAVFNGSPARNVRQNSNNSDGNPVPQTGVQSVGGSQRAE